MKRIPITQHALLTNDRVTEFSGGRDYLATGSVSDDGFFQPESVTYATRPTRADLSVRPRDVCFARMQGTKKVFEVKTDKELILSTGFAILRPDPRVINATFLKYWVASEEFQSAKDSLCTGATQKAITNGNLKTLSIPFLTLSEQDRIAGILDKADSVLRARKQVLSLASDFLRALFLEMFGDPLTNPRGLPKKRLDQFGKILTGNTPSRKDPENYGTHLEWIKSDNINTPSHYLTEAVEKLSEIGAAKARTVPEGSILVTCIAGSPDCIGNAALADRTVSFNQQINAIVPNEEVDSKFLYAQILVAKKAIQRASTNGMKGMVSKSNFAAIEFLFPEPKKQKDYGNAFRKYETMLESFYRSKEEGEALFASLQVRAFKGEL